MNQTIFVEKRVSVNFRFTGLIDGKTVGEAEDEQEMLDRHKGLMGRKRFCVHVLCYISL